MEGTAPRHSGRSQDRGRDPGPDPPGGRRGNDGGDRRQSRRPVGPERARLWDIPLSAQASPDVEAARRHTVAWLARYGVFRGESAVAEYDALRLDRLSAQFYPDAYGGGLNLANDLNGWFFVFDDQFDGELGQCPDAVSRMVEAVVEVTADQPSPARDPGGGPLVESFRDLWRRIVAEMPVEWQRRFRGHWLAYLRAHHREALDRRGEIPHSLDSLLAVKRHSVGVEPCLDLTERLAGYTLPPAVHDGFPVAAMREAATDAVIFVNDVVSLDKELAAGDVHNSVIVLRERSGGTLAEAVRQVVGLANARHRRFEELADLLPDALAAAGVPAASRRHAAHFADGMRHVIRGSLTWSLETARYDDRGVAAVSSGRQRPWAGLDDRPPSAAPARCAPPSEPAGAAPGTDTRPCAAPRSASAGLAASRPERGPVRPEPDARPA